MIIDATYTADALAWLLAWSALGLAGRVLLAERTRQHDDHPRASTKAGR